LKRKSKCAINYLAVVDDAAVPDQSHLSSSLQRQHICLLDSSPEASGIGPAALSKTYDAVQQAVVEGKA
jgi:hypothetical protein